MTTALLVVFLLGSLIVPALAQQPPPTAAQMLGQQLGVCAVAQAELIEKLNKLQAELDALKPKPEPPKENK